MEHGLYFPPSALMSPTRAKNQTDCCRRLERYILEHPCRFTLRMSLYYSSSKAAYILILKKVLAIFSGSENKWHGMTQVYTITLYMPLLFQPPGKNKVVSFHRSCWKSSLACVFSWSVPGHFWEKASWYVLELSQGGTLTISQNGQSCESVSATVHLAHLVYNHRHSLKTLTLELSIK